MTEYQKPDYVGFRNPHQNPHGHQKPTQKRQKQQTTADNRKMAESLDITGFFGIIRQQQTTGK